LSRYVFKSRLKVGSDDADDTECGRVFQARAAATGNARSPMAGTISCAVAAERRGVRHTLEAVGREPCRVGSDTYLLVQSIK